MTLATRCTACGTTFRVVQDQLRVSEGWVRCGRCNEVFSALETLNELPEEEPVSQAQVIEAEPVEEAPVPADILLEPPPAWADSGPGPATSALLDEAPGKPDDPVPGDHSIQGAAAEKALPVPDSEVHIEMPAFVREADPASRSVRPAVRRTLAAASALAALLLAGQALHAWRDAIATWVPATRPALAWACDGLGCQLAPWRQLDGLSVESSSLGQVGSTTIYQLSVVIRNRTRFELRAPALDLALTDSQGRTVARRVLTVTELGAQAGPMPAGGELSLQARLSTGDRRITGYALEIFHP